MKNLPRFSKEYFQKFRTTPVVAKPFDPKAKKAASDYIKNLKKILKNFDAQLLHVGSTALGILGKGEIEISVYSSNKDWPRVVATLRKHYGKVDNLEKEYARFNDMTNGFKVEVIVLCGYSAKVDRKLHEFLSTHPEILKEYEEIKKKYSYSKREYYIQKDKFFRKIIKTIPED